MLKDIEYHKKTHLAWIVLARPETRNAFTPDMLSSVGSALEDAKTDDGVKVVLLAAQGASFCSGGNIKDMARGDLAGWNMKHYLRNHVHRLLLKMEDIDKPIIAVINGAASGGGFDLSLACDLRVASEKATFCASYVRLGLAPGGGGAYNLSRIIGMSKALELLLTGRFFNADEALAMGIINHITPHDSLKQSAERLALEIAQWPLPSIRAIKRAAYNATGCSLRAHLDYMSSQLALLSQTPDHQKAVRGLLAKIKNG